MVDVVLTEEEPKSITIKGTKCVLTMGKILKDPTEDSTGSGFVRCECEDGRVLSEICMIAKLASPYREEIGSELQTLRVQKGLTVRELGEMCDMQHSSIVKIENGRYNVSVDILGKVADALGYRLTFEERR